MTKNFNSVMKIGVVFPHSHGVVVVTPFIFTESSCWQSVCVRACVRACTCAWGWNCCSHYQLPSPALYLAKLNKHQSMTWIHTVLSIDVFTGYAYSCISSSIEKWSLRGMITTMDRCWAGYKKVAKSVFGWEVLPILTSNTKHERYVLLWQMMTSPHETHPFE